MSFDNNCWLQRPPLDDPVALEAVQKAMTDAGVTIHSGYYLARWNDSLDIPEKITSATFTSANVPLRLSCQVDEINQQRRILCLLMNKSFEFGV